MGDMNRWRLMGERGRYNTCFNGVYLCPASPQGLWHAWGRRVRRSLGRGCHYLGLGVLSITNYIPEEVFMGPVVPGKNYDRDYVYTCGEYVIPEYM